jgi:8-oxo-dGTP diphosphatase
MVRVVAGVVVEEGRVMVTRRGPHVRLAGLWEFPGGKVEAGEDDQTALARELWEELQIRVEVGECVGENIHTEERGPFCLVAYRVTIVEGRPVLSEHDDIQWMDPTRLHELNWAPADLPLLEKVTSGLAD